MLKHVIMIASLLGVVIQAQGAASGICWALPVTAKDRRLVIERVESYKKKAVLVGDELICPLCRAQFKNFDTHIISHPEVGRIYRCNCGLSWASENFLKRHLEESNRFRNLYLQPQGNRASRQRASQRPLMIPQPNVPVMSNEQSAENYQHPAMRAAIQEMVVQSRPLRPLVQVEEAYEPCDPYYYDQEWDQKDCQAEKELNLLASHTCEGFYFNGDQEQNEFDDNVQGGEEAVWEIFER